MSTKHKDQVATIDSQLVDPISSPSLSDNPIPTVEQTRACPSCGCTPASDEKSCRQCGKELTDIGKNSGKAKRKPPKLAKVNCPYCGELITKRFKKCPACRTSLKGAFDKVPIQTVGGDFSEPKAGIVAQVAQIPESEVGRSLIVDFPAVLEEPKLERQRCDAPPEEGMKAMEPPTPADSPSVMEPIEAAECRSEDADSSSPVGPVVGDEPAEAVSGTMMIPESISSVDSAQVEVSIETSGDEKRQVEDEASVGTVPTVEPPAVIQDAGKADEHVAPVDFAPAKESSRAEIVGEVGCSPSGNVCVAIVPKNSEEPIVRTLEVKGNPMKPPRKRKLKLAKSPIIPSAPPLNDIGYTRGVITVSGQTSERR